MPFLHEVFEPAGSPNNDIGRVSGEFINLLFNVCSPEIAPVLDSRVFDVGRELPEFYEDLMGKLSSVGDY